VQVASIDSENSATNLTALVKAMGIEKSVRLMEWPESVDELISACDFIVAPFLSERFSSVTLLEAMAIGKPIIGTDIGEQREIIANELNGYLVSPGDVEELAGRIVVLLTHPEELDRLSQEASVMAEQYSVPAYVQGLQRLYLELAAKPISELQLKRTLG
jgi:glycosyltransferase involved in cell wall biosynthesis